MSKKRRHVWSIRGTTPLATGHFNAGSGRKHFRRLYQLERQRQRAALTNDRPEKQDQVDPEEPLAQDGSQAPESAPIEPSERRQLAGVHPGRIARHTGAG